MKPSVPPISPEKAEAAREVLNEYDDIVTHDRVLTREQRVGQFVMGGGIGSGITGTAVLAVQRVHEILDGSTGVSDKFTLIATAVGGVVGGLYRMASRSADARRVANFEKERAQRQSTATP